MGAMQPAKHIANSNATLLLPTIYSVRAGGGEGLGVSMGSLGFVDDTIHNGQHIITLTKVWYTHDINMVLD